MADVFERILGQPQVREYLRACVASGRTAQSYLFTGPVGSNKTQAAIALAQGVMCASGGCDACEVCRRIARLRHPDVHMLQPEGASGYLIEQIRGVVSDVNLAPIESAVKVYIINRADLLGSAGANAFLKTLEEPPHNVIFILMARTQESVLPTILSRCQVVPFRHIPPTEAAGIVTQHTGAAADMALKGIAASAGSITGAIEFCQSKERQALRVRVLEIMGSLRFADDADLFDYSKELTLLCKAPLEAVRLAQEEQLQEDSEFLAKSTIKTIEAKNKRELSAKNVECFREVIAVAKSWLRDVLMTQTGTNEFVINNDVSAALRQAAFSVKEADIVSACDCADKYAGMIAYNVSVQSCMDALLLELKTILYA